MKMNQRFSLIAAGAALAAGMLPVTAHADAVAQAILNVSNFQFAAGNNGLGAAAAGSLAPLITIAPGAFTTTADAKGELDGVNANGVAYGFLGKQALLGNTGTYVPGAQLLGAPIAHYAAATSDQTGNALFATANATTDSVVSIKPTGDGTMQGNVNLQAEFSFINPTAGTKVEIAFDAVAFLRAHLSQSPGTATAAYTWTMSIVTQDANGNDVEVFSWAPDGILGSGIVGGIEYADAFRLNDTRSRVSAGNSQLNSSVTNPNSSYFEAETVGLGVGMYTVSIRQTTLADAFFVPEPTSIALLGVALLGAAGVSRRRSTKK